jgi:hypothetical protein
MEKSDESRTIEEMSKGENIVKWIKGQRRSWISHLQRIEEDRMPKKIFLSRTGRDEKKGKTQEKMERGSRKRSASAGSEKMERVGGR